MVSPTGNVVFDAARLLYSENSVLPEIFTLEYGVFSMAIICSPGSANL